MGDDELVIDIGVSRVSQVRAIQVSVHLTEAAEWKRYCTRCGERRTYDPAEQRGNSRAVCRMMKHGSVLFGQLKKGAGSLMQHELQQFKLRVPRAICNGQRVKAVRIVMSRVPIL